VKSKGTWKKSTFSIYPSSVHISFLIKEMVEVEFMLEVSLINSLENKVLKITSSAVREAR